MASHTTIAHPNLSKTAFWDVDFAQLDYERRSLFVMEKVMNYGLLADVLELFRHYGEARIRREITGASYLKKTAISFLCLVLDLEKTDFKCFARSRSDYGYWDF